MTVLSARPRALPDAELLRRLVAFDTTSHKSNRAIVDFICDYLDRPGIRLERNPAPDGEKSNLVAVAGPEVDPEERAGLTLSGHVDVVPATEPEWSADPFELIETGDRYVGRGACDMKGFVALAMQALLAAAEAGRRHPLAVLLTYDEEVGTLGARHFVETWPRERPLPRRVLVGEPTSLQAVRMHKGHYQLHLEVEGRGAHSGYPHLGHNAIEPAGRAIAALSDLRRRLEGESCPHGEHFGEVPYVALNVARVRGGTAINVVPESCTVELGFRVLPEMDAEAVAARVRETLAETLAGERYELRRVHETPPFLLDETSDLHRAVCEILGQERTVAVSYGSDAGWLSRGGHDCLLWGPGDIAVAHRPDEWMPKDELRRAAGLLDRFVERFCGASASD